MKESDIVKTRSSEIKNANKERFQNGTSKLAKRIYYGYYKNDTRTSNESNCIGWR